MRSGTSGWSRPLSHSRQDGRGEREPRAQIAFGGVVTVLLDLALPVALFYALRAAGVGQVVALLISGAPPAARIAYTFLRRRRINVIGAIVIAAVALGIVASLLGGDARALLVRNAVLGLPFALWMFATLRARRPMTYEIAIELLPSRADAFERAWSAEASFRRVWRRLTVLWGCGLLVQTAASTTMAATLPVDDVPGLDSLLWVGLGIVLLGISQIALHQSGAMRAIFAPAGDAR